jgi:7-cyano-7-deazaguanine reductase
VKTYKRPPDVTEITLVSDEVTTMCPYLHNPDFHRVTIRYEPDELILDTKSLKFWFRDNREEPGYGSETFAQAVLEAVWSATEPWACDVLIESKPRGGIAINARAIKTRIR